LKLGNIADSNFDKTVLTTTEIVELFVQEFITFNLRNKYFLTVKLLYTHILKMECDSIMDISMNFNTIDDDISVVNEISMEVSALATPVPESWNTTTTSKVETVDAMEILKKIHASVPNSNPFLERQKKAVTSKHECFIL
jgi:hypothetical protein